MLLNNNEQCPKVASTGSTHTSLGTLLGIGQHTAVCMRAQLSLTVFYISLQTQTFKSPTDERLGQQLGIENCKVLLVTQKQNKTIIANVGG